MNGSMYIRSQSFKLQFSCSDPMKSKRTLHGFIHKIIINNGMPKWTFYSNAISSNSKSRLNHLFIIIIYHYAIRIHSLLRMFTHGIYVMGSEHFVQSLIKPVQLYTFTLGYLFFYILSVGIYLLIHVCMCGISP